MRHAGVNLDKPPAGEGRSRAVLHRLKAQTLVPMTHGLASPAAHGNRHQFCRRGAAKMENPALTASFHADLTAAGYQQRS
jgi:hypothetical protein